MAHPNEELIRKGYDAFTSGDMETLRELFAEDIAWHVPGRNALSGDYQGKDAVFGFFAKLLEGTGGSLKLEIHDVFANDEHGVVLVRSSAEREGRSLDSRDVHVSHIRDGKITEFWNHPEDQHAVDEFWGG